MPHSGAPPSGSSHPLLLGETFTSSHPSQSYCALRYDFKPISAGRFRPGQVQLQPDQSKVVVQLPDTTCEGADVAFSGRYESSRDNLDCVAIFDGTSWRLELVEGLVKTLKATGRSGQPNRAATPQPQVPAEAVDAAAVAALTDDARRGKPSPSPAPEEQTAAAQTSRPAAVRPDDQRKSAAQRAQQQSMPPAPRSAAPARQTQPREDVPDDAPDWERDFYKAPESDASEDDEDLNRCSDDDSDLGIEHF